MSNLEPIDEKDLDLASKFGEASKTENNGENKVENPFLKIKEEPAKEIISAEKESAYNKILSRVKSKNVDNFDQEDVKSDAEKTIEKQDAESQVQHLVDIATTKGVFYAVKVARHMDDNYILDMFHDRLLADDLHSALVQKGLIEEI